MHYQLKQGHSRNKTTGAKGRPDNSEPCDESLIKQMRRGGELIFEELQTQGLQFTDHSQIKVKDRGPPIEDLWGSSQPSIYVQWMNTTITQS